MQFTVHEDPVALTKVVRERAEVLLAAARAVQGPDAGGVARWLSHLLKPLGGAMRDLERDEFARHVVFEPPASEVEVARVESRLGAALPRALRSFFLKGSAGVEIRVDGPRMDVEQFDEAQLQAVEALGRDDPLFPFVLDLLSTDAGSTSPHQFRLRLVDLPRLQAIGVEGLSAAEAAELRSGWLVLEVGSRQGVVELSLEDGTVRLRDDELISPLASSFSAYVSKRAAAFFVGGPDEQVVAAYCPAGVEPPFFNLMDRVMTAWSQGQPLGGWPPVCVPSDALPPRVAHAVYEAVGELEIPRDTDDYYFLDELGGLHVKKVGCIEPQLLIEGAIDCEPGFHYELHGAKVFRCQLPPEVVPTESSKCFEGEPMLELVLPWSCRHLFSFRRSQDPEVLRLFATALTPATMMDQPRTVPVLRVRYRAPAGTVPFVHISQRIAFARPKSR